MKKVGGGACFPQAGAERCSMPGCRPLRVSTPASHHRGRSEGLPGPPFRRRDARYGPRSTAAIVPSLPGTRPSADPSAPGGIRTRGLPTDDRLPSPLGHGGVCYIFTCQGSPKFSIGRTLRTSPQVLRQPVVCVDASGITSLSSRTTKKGGHRGRPHRKFVAVALGLASSPSCEVRRILVSRTGHGKAARVSRDRPAAVDVGVLRHCV